MVSADSAQENDESEDEDDNSSDLGTKISHENAIKIFENALQYVENHPQSEPTDIVLMRRWIDIALRSRINSQKQQKITNFFN